MSTILEVAEKAENILHTAFAMKGDEFAFSLPEAMLIGITTDENGKLIDVQPEVASDPDIYTLLEKVNPEVVSVFSAVGLITCGWAAPINDETGEPDMAPSQSPHRRRVRLFACVSREGVASVLRFQDDPDTPILDAGEARGPLADAIIDMMNRG